MTLQEFYDRIGGDYKATISRLPSEALIKKFVLKYPGVDENKIPSKYFVDCEIPF